MAQNDNFRDSISTVDESGKRVWIFPKMPKGAFFNKRKVLSYVLLLILFLTPYIKIGGEPLFLFNVLSRKFVLFGQVFWPHDFHIFAIAMIVMIVFVILFTVVFGRLFCGWICPQTIFMEMVFRRIEYWIEGDFTKQKKLKKQAWNREKFFKKIAKHSIFWLLSFLIANTFLSYIIGYEELWEIILDNPKNHMGGLVSISVFTTIFYLVFSKMREQVCTTVCPYGRLQGVLLDNNSLTVAYDYKRGENRGKFRKKEDRKEAEKGDCIDCHQCVDVCPTGIDIRNGTQLECVGCTACIDACDFVMDSVDLKKGLIRYDSIEGIEKGKSFELTTRVKAYSAVLVSLVALLVVLLFSRSDFEATIMRTRGTLFQEVEQGVISNIYDFTVVNKSNRQIPIEFKLLEGKGEIKMIGDKTILNEYAESKGKFMIYIKREDLIRQKEKLKIGVYDGDKLIEEVSTSFITPVL